MAGADCSFCSLVARVLLPFNNAFATPRVKRVPSPNAVDAVASRHSAAPQQEPRTQ